MAVRRVTLSQVRGVFFVLELRQSCGGLLAAGPRPSPGVPNSMRLPWRKRSPNDSLESFLEHSVLFLVLHHHAAFCDFLATPDTIFVRRFHWMGKANERGGTMARQPTPSLATMHRFEFPSDEKPDHVNFAMLAVPPLTLLATEIPDSHSARRKNFRQTFDTALCHSLCLFSRFPSCLQSQSQQMPAAFGRWKYCPCWFHSTS